MDKQDYKIQAIQYGGEDIIVADNPLSEVVVEADRIYPSLDYLGFSISGTACVVAGVTGELSIGILPKDGVVMQLSLGTAVGFDVSASANYKQEMYSGTEVATGDTMTGLSESNSIGYGGFSFGKTKDAIIPPEKGGVGVESTTGQNWNITNMGATVGSKTTFGASATRTYTFDPLYLYKK